MFLLNLKTNLLVIFWILFRFVQFLSRLFFSNYICKLMASKHSRRTDRLNRRLTDRRMYIGINVFIWKVCWLQLFAFWQTTFLLRIQKCFVYFLLNILRIEISKRSENALLSFDILLKIIYMILPNISIYFLLKISMLFSNSFISLFQDLKFLISHWKKFHIFTWTYRFI